VVSAALYPPGRQIVDILEALGLHGPRLFLVSLLVAIIIAWLSWRLAHWGRKRRRRRV
jgi:hypothetical protein